MRKLNIAAVLGLIAGVSGAYAPQAPNPRNLLRLIPKVQRRSGQGWTNAHAKRVARKIRNVKRHRAVMKRRK